MAPRIGGERRQGTGVERPGRYGDAPHLGQPLPECGSRGGGAVRVFAHPESLASPTDNPPNPPTPHPPTCHIPPNAPYPPVVSPRN
ncbi:hypothetical protein JCM18897A_42430 [Streptomyces sp. JCM 18897]